MKLLAAVCEECGGEMGLPGILDYNTQLIDDQYNKMEHSN